MSTSFTATGRYYVVYVDGAEVSRHSQEREACQKCTEVLDEQPEADVRYRHEYEVVALRTRFGGGVIPEVLPAEVSAEYNGLTPDYYISTTGSDSNDGLTPATAWALTAINSKRGTYDGNVVGVLDGTYNIPNILGTPAEGGHSGRARLELAGNTAADPTILVSQTPRGAILDDDRATVRAANPTLDWGQAVLGVRESTGDGVIIDGLKFTGGHYRFITMTRLYGAEDVTIRNCHFTDQSYDYANAAGRNSAHIYSEERKRVLISNCRFDTGGAPADSNRHADIQFFGGATDSSDNCTVEYCTIIGTNESTIRVYWKSGGGSAINTFATLRYCYIDNSNAYALGTSCCTPNLDDINSSDIFNMHNNIFVAGNGAPCIWHDRSDNQYAGTANWYNNTFVGNFSTDGTHRNNHWMEGANQFNWYNNIVAPSTPTGGDGDIGLPDFANIGTLDYNMYPETSPRYVEGDQANVYTAIADWRTATGEETNSSEDDPEFVATGAEANYYKLGATSPAKGFDANGDDIGAWGGAAPPSQIGADFT